MHTTDIEPGFEQFLLVKIIEQNDFHFSSLAKKCSYPKLAKIARRYLTTIYERRQ
jgi:hypothetical protein